MGQSYQLNKSKYLLESEVLELKRVLSLFKDKDPRNTALIGLALASGARATEILNLRWLDLEESERTVFFRGIKGSNDREIPVKRDLFQQIAGLRKEAQGQERVFNISYPRLVQIWQDYRPCRKKFHSLRHSFALELYKKTRDLRLVQLALGHRNIQNTMVYANYVYSTEELRKLIL